MSSKKIGSMIKKALADEAKRGRLLGHLRQLSEMRSLSPSEDELKTAVQFVAAYVMHVPFYTEQALAAAQAVGRAKEMQKVIRAAEAYWLDPNDVIPDHLGLVGIIDDAYCSLSMIAAVSARCAQETGKPLLPHDIRPANQMIRNLIGEPHASILDSYVQRSLGSNILNQMLQAAFAGAAFPSFGPDPVWGNTPVSEIVDHQIELFRG